MAVSNRLANLSHKIFFEITKNLRIFDLENLESSGLFELDINGFSDRIQEAFERLTEINIEYNHCNEYEEQQIQRMVLRCGFGLKLLKVKCVGLSTGGFLRVMHSKYDSFLEHLAARCPNIEIFAKADYKLWDMKDNTGFGHYISERTNF